MRQRKTIPFVQDVLRGGSDGDDAEKTKTSSLGRQFIIGIMPQAKATKNIVFFLLCSTCFMLWKRNLFDGCSREQQETEVVLLFSPVQLESDTYHVWDCPETPPPGYPREYSILDVLANWNTGETSPKPARSNANSIYQGICIFDLATTSHTKSVEQIIQNYRAAEVPFVVRNDPDVQKTVKLWNRPEYLAAQLQGKKFQSTRSNQTRMTYYSLDRDYNEIPDDFVPFTHNAPMSYQEWNDYATRKAQQKQFSEKEYQYAYLRLDACLADKNCDSTYRGSSQRLDDADFIYHDMPFFFPGHSNFYQIDGNKSRGIQCRFGTPLLTAECHFDNERNYIAMIQGSRRYLLAHPKNCAALSLYPQKHPLERHTRLDWRKLFTTDHPEASLHAFPQFAEVTINEVVLQAGDVLYLPTYWFHHIISLSDRNIQCNTRSGYSVEFDQTIYDCGFFYDFPS
eukprot:scaffold15451_cov169-Amphora_coffeaeformis.AAC.3